MNEDEMSALKRTAIATILVFLVVGLFTYFSQGVQAQQQWVACKNIETGEVQSFPDRCPTWGWMPA